MYIYEYICSTLQSSTNTGLAATAQIFLVPSVVHLFLRVTLVAGAWAGQHARFLLYMYNIYIYIVYKICIISGFGFNMFQHLSTCFTPSKKQQSIGIIIQFYSHLLDGTNLFKHASTCLTHQTCLMLIWAQVTSRYLYHWVGTKN